MTFRLSIYGEPLCVVSFSSTIWVLGCWSHVPGCPAGTNDMPAHMGVHLTNTTQKGQAYAVFVDSWAVTYVLGT